MDKNLEQTQPTDLESTQPKKDDTQPIKPVKKQSRWRAFFAGLLGFLLLVGLGAFGGYSSGIGARQQAETSIRSQQLMEQYQYALVDMQFQHYDAAKQRLEYIISKDPAFPGAQEELTKLLVLSSIPTPTIAPTVTPTPDISGVENAFLRAQQLIAAQDWQNALAALDIVRKLDATYKTAQVDGMYYFALRNYGNDLILKQGNLEGGIYYLTLAERFGPLDTTSTQLRESARIYIIGASFWELDWRKAIDYFSQTNPNLWDGTMTAGERLNIAYQRRGDELFEAQEYCAAYEVYNYATLPDERTAARLNKSYIECYPPTPTPEVIATDPPVVTP